MFHSISATEEENELLIKSNDDDNDSIAKKSDDDDNDSIASFGRSMTISPINKYEDSPLNKVKWQSMLMVDTGTYTTGKECWESLHFHLFEALNFELFEYIKADGILERQKHVRGDGFLTEAFEIKTLTEQNTVHILVNCPNREVLNCYILEFDLTDPEHLDFYYFAQSLQNQEEEIQSKKEYDELLTVFEDNISQEEFAENEESREEFQSSLWKENNTNKTEGKEKISQKTSSSLFCCCQKKKDVIRTKK